MKWPHGTDTLGKATAGRLTVPPRRLTLRGLPGARRCRMLPHDPLTDSKLPCAQAPVC